MALKIPEPEPLTTGTVPPTTADAVTPTATVNPENADDDAVEVMTSKVGLSPKKDTEDSAASSEDEVGLEEPEEQSDSERKLSVQATAAVTAVTTAGSSSGSSRPGLRTFAIQPTNMLGKC